MLRHAALICSVGAILFGCAPTSEGDRSEGRTTAGIVEGNAVSGPPYDSVGSVHLGGERRLACSATLIAPDAVVTAAHCVQFWPANEILVQFQGSASGALDDDFRDVSEAVVHPDFDGSEPNDIAVLRLATAVTDIVPIAPLPQALVFEDIDINSLPLDIVGFGADQDGEIGTRNSKLLTLGGLGCTVLGCPTDLRNSAELVSYEQLDGGPCALDSGGPALVDRNGQVYLGAITVDGDQNCTQWGVSVSIAPFTAWIEDVVGAPLGTDGGIPDAGTADDAGMSDVDAGMVGAPSLDSGAVGSSCTATPVVQINATAGLWLMVGAWAFRRRFTSAR